MLCAAAAGVRVGYCLAAEPVARETLDADDPIDGEPILFLADRYRSGRRNIGKA